MIRLLTSLDAEQYQRLRLKSLQTDGKYYLSSYEVEKEYPLRHFELELEQAMQPPIFGYYGFFVDDQLAGYIHLQKNWSDKQQHTAQLINLYVDPDFRGQSIGTKLFDHVTRLGKQNGLEQLTLTCSAANTPAIGLYAKHGFKMIGTEKNGLKWDGAYEDIAHFRKDLVSAD